MSLEKTQYNDSDFTPQNESSMNSSPSRIDGAWSSIKPVVSAPFELAMMVVMMSSLAIFSTFDDLKEKVFGELPLEEDSITSAREISSNATQFIMSQIHQTRQDSSNKKRQTFWVSKAGSLNNIELRNDYLELPEAIPSDEITSLLYPQGYQVQVEVKAVGLNMADIFAIQGLYSATPQGSFIPGLEFSGIITSLSPEYEEYIASGRFEQDQRKKDREFYLKYGHKDYNVKNANRKRDNNNDTKNAESDIKTDIEFHEDIHNYTRDGRAKPLRVGDRVMGVSRFGAYTTIINADSRLIRHIPEGWSFAEGASLLVQGLTAAYGLLELGDTKAGDVVLVHSAAGGVGQLCLEICRSIGAYPIATVGSAKKAMYLLKKSQGDLHISQIIDRSICGTTYRNPLEPIAKSIERLATAASTKAAQDADQARINSSDHEETNDDEDNDGNKRHHNVKYNSNQTGLTSNVATLAIPLLNIASKVVSLGVNIAGPTAAWFGDKLCHREHKAEDFGLALDRALKAISAAKKAKNRLEFASNLNSNATEVSVVTWNLLKDKVAIQASENKLVRSRRSNNSDKREVVVKSPSMVRGIDVAMDSLLGFCFQPTLQRLAPEGKILIFGAGAYATPTNSPNYAHLGWEFLKRPFVDPMDLTPNNTSITGFNLIWLWSKIEEFDHLYELLHMHVQTKPTIGKTFDFKHIRKGLSYLQSGSSVGKVVMLVGNQD